MMFSVGQKVVCVDDSCWEQHPEFEPIRKGAIFTVLGYDPDKWTCPSVTLAESHVGYWVRASRFRPVVERKTSIEVFQQMLKPTDAQVRNLVICDKLSDILADYCLAVPSKTHPPPKA